MARPAIDHRRTTAERNLGAILDATERLLARHAPVSTSAVATTWPGSPAPRCSERASAALAAAGPTPEALTG
jgi:hypothetical protein